MTKQRSSVRIYDKTRYQQLIALHETIKKHFVQTGLRPRIADLLHLEGFHLLKRIDFVNAIKRFSPITKYLRPPGPPKHFFTAAINIELGIVQVDFAEFHRNYQVQNDRAIGFILAVDTLSNKLMGYVTPSKDGKHWRRAVDKFVKEHKYITRFVSDQESALTSDKFHKEMEDKYGIKWTHIRLRNKAFSAESYIGHMKQWLSVILDWSPPERKGRWVDHFYKQIDFYNNSKIAGTSFTPNDINPSNVDKFIAQKFKDPHFVESYNINHLSNLPNQIVDDLFKFREFAKVRVRKSAEKDVGFQKRSVKGSYSNNEYIIVKRSLWYIPSAKGYQAGYHLYNPKTKQVLKEMFYTSDLIQIPDPLQNNV